ncbi:hypothetical protein C8R43DRAFT_826104, partial [Mycena crocata]
DGSRSRGGVGGAARAYTPHGTIIIREYLGRSQDHLSVEGEILGAILALQIIKSVAVPSLTRATIFIDCQQAIFELASGRSRHLMLLERFNAELRDRRRGFDQLCLTWVPGHDGVAMNELVDKDAKEA